MASRTSSSAPSTVRAGRSPSPADAGLSSLANMVGRADRAQRPDADPGDHRTPGPAPNPRSATLTSRRGCEQDCSSAPSRLLGLSYLAGSVPKSRRELHPSGHVEHDHAGTARPPAGPVSDRVTAKGVFVSNYSNGKSSVTPYVVAKGAARLLDFMAKVFAADVYLTVPNPDGSIGHAEARIGDSVVMVFDSHDGWPPTPAFLSLYVEDADAAVGLALEQGAKLITEVMTSAITGDRGGRVQDPVGSIWWVQTHQRDVTSEEMHARFTDPGELAIMEHAQESFDQAMRPLGQ